MSTRRFISYCLLGVAALIALILVSTFLGGDVKGFGSLVFAEFFLLIAAWIIGDY